TINGCYVTFDDKDRGSLETGKIADMVILSEDPYAIPKERLSSLKAEKLYLAGKEYSSCVRPVAGAMLGGILSSSKAY
ncbi:MAG: metal-dependent hydrolase with the TIM-barrel fold protein, partial [Firmicutes bacterium]|nr:metal-dependent hydrolase with the TIM-barrel fold protein [Bacillota bacterium]